MRGRQWRKLKNPEKFVGKYNKAVKILFGTEGEEQGIGAKRGNVIISDVIESGEGDNTKLLNHVAIDRFTGGAIEGALFTEKVSYTPDKSYTIKMLIDIENIKRMAEEENVEVNKVVQAFKASVDDICKGALPLGGGVNRGNGVFEGSHNGKIYEDYLK